MGVGSSLPAPSFLLRREILAQGGSLWCRCAWCGWFWPLASAGPHIPVCPGHSCMLFADMMALDGAAVVDHARSACRQSKGSGPGLVPLRTRPRNWGEGGVRSLTPLPCKGSVGSSPRVRGARVPGRLFGAVLCCPGLPSIVVAWVSAFHLWGGGGLSTDWVGGEGGGRGESRSATPNSRGKLPLLRESRTAAPLSTGAASAPWRRPPVPSNAREGGNYATWLLRLQSVPRSVWARWNSNLPSRVGLCKY